MTTTTTVPPLTDPQPPVRQEVHFARLKNLSSRRPRGWVKVAVPYHSPINAAHATEFVTDRGLLCPALKAYSIGTHSTIWAIKVPFAENQTVEGHLLSALTNAPVQGQFQAHQWVVDHLESLFASCTIRLRNADDTTTEYTTTPIKPPTILPGHSTVHQRWHTASMVKGFILETWVTFWSNSPVADFSAVLTWSDPTVDAPSIHVEAISLNIGEYPVLDHAGRHGIAWRPERAGDSLTGKWVYVVSGPRWIKDGGGLPFSGRLLCLPQDFTAPMPPTLVEDLETLYAAFEAPLVGCCDKDTWEGHWMAHANTGRLDSILHEQAMVGRVESWRWALYPGMDWYDDRAVGCMKSPSSTGGQEDFGATKGTPALYTPEWVDMAAESVHADLFRGYCYHESDGSRLDPAKHPGWRSWAMRTHYQASSDFLGKRVLAWGEGGEVGWTGYDDEHRSTNNLHALYALTGDPIALYLIEHSSTHDIACGAHYGYVDSARAFGRRALTYANVLILAEPGSQLEQRQLQLLETELALLLANWTPAKFNHGVDILGVGLDDRSGITFEGKGIPYWSAWVNAILCVGAYAAYKVSADRGLAQADGWLDVTKRVSRTVTRYGYFKSEDGLWWGCAAVAWGTPLLGVEEGAPLPDAAYTRDSTLVNEDRGGVVDWQLMAPLIFCEVHEANDPDMARAKDIVRDFTGNHEAETQDKSEWYACVRSVPPVPM